MGRLILLAIALVLTACGSARNGSRIKRDVPIAINISLETNATVNFVNLDYFRLQLIQDLEQFQAVNFDLVDESESPEVVLKMHVGNFTLWPRDERVSRRTLRRNVVVGTDAAGKPVYQTVTAQVDIVQIQRRSNARFETVLNIKGTPGLTFKRTFSPNYNYATSYVDNVQGDSRAVDPSLLSRGMPIEPTDQDFLLILARQEMVRRLNSELRRYFDAEVRQAADTVSVQN